MFSNRQTVLSFAAAVITLMGLCRADVARAATCTIDATTTPYVCPFRDAGPQPASFPTYRTENNPTTRAIAFGTVHQIQTQFGSFNHEVGDTVFSCSAPAPTPAVHCPMPTWDSNFARKPATAATKTLVAVWNDTAAGWASTKFYVPGQGDNVGAQIAVSATPPPGYPAEITPSPIPSGSFGGYFLLDVPVGATRSPAFTYRASLPSKVTFRIQARVVTESGAVNGTASSATDFKPALGFTTAPTNAAAGSCAGPITVATQDGNGAVVDTLTTNRVKLIPRGSPGFIFLDPACAYPTETLGIRNPVPPPSGGQRPPEVSSTRQATFWFKLNSAQAAFPISADYVDTDNRTIFTAVQAQVIQPGTPIALKLTVPGSVGQGTCSSAIHIGFVDRYDNEARFPANKAISVGGGRLYTSANCSGSPITSFVATPSMMAQDLYLMEPESGTARIVVSGSGLQGASADVRILANRLLARAADLPRAQNMARRLFRRLVGSPLLDGAVLDNMASLLLQGKALDAARVATTDPSHGFYNVTLRQFFTKMSNRLNDPSERFSDFVATGIGTVRDNRDAREFLTGNRIYVGQQYRTNDLNACANTIVYKSNFHFAQLEDQRKDLFTELVPVRQCSYNTAVFTSDSPIPSDDAAGLATTWKWGQQHIVAGTNRRALEFMMQQFNCLTTQQMSDTSGADWHVRRDVDRAPGADPRVYANSCRGCHALLDGASGAFAFHDWYERPNNNGGPEDSRLFHLRGGYDEDAAVSKMNINATTFPAGWKTSNNSWVLLLTPKQQQLLQIDNGIPTAGNGVYELGRALANSGSFRSCMASRAFQLVCLRTPTEADAASVADLANYLADTNYNMRSVIERAAVLEPCLGGGETQ